ncbi:MAG: EAL domain-containing protein [Pseudomonadales bacterium]|nr:EAL domain-containing protein [Pseudomonadales bacterium]
MPENTHRNASPLPTRNTVAHRLLHALLLSCLLLSTLLVNAYGADTALAPQSITPDRQSLLVDAHWFSTPNPISFLEAQERFNSNKATLKQSSQQYLHLNNTEQTYWIQQTLYTEDQAALQHLHIVLDRQYPQFDNVDLYMATEWESPSHFQQSDRLDTPGSDAQSRMMAFPITLKANKRYTITLAIKSRAQQSLALELMKPQQFYTSVKNSEFVWGIFYGIFLVAAIFNLLIYFSLKEKLYLYYIGYVIAIALTQAGISTHGAYYLWGSSSQWSQISHLFFIGIAVVFGVLFARPFLNTEELAPKTDKALITMLPIGIMISIGAMVLPYQIIITFTDISLAVLTFVMILASIITWNSGRKTARFFLLGWGSLLVCTLTYILTLRGFLPPNVFTLHAAQLGTVAEILIITIAIGDRIQQHQEEKRIAIQKQEKAITALKEAETALTYRAYHDKITGLPNRDKLIEIIDAELARQHQQGSLKHLYVVLIKIKRLREINHTLGHYVGDMVAKTTAQALNNLLRKLPKRLSIPFNEDKGEYLAAIQGVNLVFLLRHPKNSAGAATVIGMLNQLPQQFQFESISLDISTSCGLCFAPDHGKDSETLLRNAFVAVEESQTRGQLCSIYNEDVNPYSQRRLSLMGDLCKAIESDELELYMHPQLDTRKTEIISAEALLRWNHKQYGFIPPDEFVPLAESSGAIKPLTRWVIRNSLSLLKQLHNKHYLLGVSINLSAHNLEEPDLTDFIVAQLARHNIAPEYVTLEITETAMVMNPELAHDILVRWNEIGLATSIDDFGTGYSSLSHLKKLPMNELKIDRSFITDMQNNTDDTMIVRSTLDISHNMNMRVVAEGVETEEIMEALTEMGCDIIQGYLLTPPLGIGPFTEWLEGCVFPVKGNRKDMLASQVNKGKPPLRSV